VNQSPSGIFINQSKYVYEILKKYGLNTSDIVGTLMDIKDKLDQIGTPVDATKYRSMIGALMYLTSSRPDIIHATYGYARYQAHPTEKHLKEIKRIFRYLWGTVNMGLWYTKDSGFELTGFSDADYARCKDTFKSTSGGAQFIGEKLVSWSSKKQHCTSLSTALSEYVSLSACCAHDRRDLPKDTPIDRLEVLMYDTGKRSKDPDPVTRISKLDISDPLHLYPNDSNALIVVSIKLKGIENYMYDAMIELPKCVCNAFESFKKHSQLLKLMQFLIGLDDSYMRIRSSILSKEVLPDAYAFVSNVPYRQNIQRNNQNNSSGPSRPNNLNNNKQDEQIATFISLIKDNKVGKNMQANMAAKENKVIVAFDENRCYFLNHDLNLKNVLGLRHWYCRLHLAEPVLNVLKESLQIDKKDNIANDLNKGKSDSSSSSVSGSNINTTDFPVDSRNGADSSNGLVATQNEKVATLEENVFLGVIWIKIQVHLKRNGTWEMVELPKGRKAIGSKWIYKIRFMSSSEIDRYKARLVAQGFGKKEGVDYEETFSPVVKMVTVRCLLNIVVSMSWPIFQIYVNNAFLYGDLEEVVYMKPPEGYFPSDNKSKSDYSLYTKSDKGVFLALLVYVDDIIITVVDTDKGICLNQKKYVLDLLSEYVMLACKPAKTPLMPKLGISNEASDKDPLLENITDYQKLMGK
nr:uncharacterized mitochondrial protein AtMg00810-like [Tanacetum cinerariifolium]